MLGRCFAAVDQAADAPAQAWRLTRPGYSVFRRITADSFASLA